MGLGRHPLPTGEGGRGGDILFQSSKKRKQVLLSLFNAIQSSEKRKIF